MDPADRRPFVRPLIALIERIAPHGNGTILVSSTLVDRELRPVPQHVPPRPPPWSNVAISASRDLAIGDSVADPGLQVVGKFFKHPPNIGPAPDRGQVCTGRRDA
jgi:hypothetical protein